MRAWRNRVEKIEQLITSDVLVLHFHNGSWRALPAGSDVEVVVQLLREDARDGPRPRLLPTFGRSLPQEDEGELVRLLRDIGRSRRARSPAGVTADGQRGEHPG